MSLEMRRAALLRESGRELCQQQEAYQEHDRHASPSCHAEALGLLALHLEGAAIPEALRNMGWMLVERWLAQFVEEKHREQVA